MAHFKAMLGTAEGQAALEAEKLAILAEADARERLRAKLVGLNLDDEPLRRRRSASREEESEESDGVLVGEGDEEGGWPVSRAQGDVRQRAARTAASSHTHAAEEPEASGGGGVVRRGAAASASGGLARGSSGGASGLFGGPTWRELWRSATSKVSTRAGLAQRACRRGAARAKKWATLTLHGKRSARRGCVRELERGIRKLL